MVIIPVLTEEEEQDSLNFSKAIGSPSPLSIFFTTEIYTWAGLTRYYVLITIDYATRKVEVVGISQQPYGDWMKQMATISFDDMLSE